MVFDGKDLWGIGYNPTTTSGILCQIDRNTGAVMETYTLPSLDGSSLHCDGEYLWVSVAVSNVVLKFDLSNLRPGGTLQPIAQFTVTGATDVVSFGAERGLRTTFVKNSSGALVAIEDPSPMVTHGHKNLGGRIVKSKTITQLAFPTPYLVLPTDDVIQVSTTTTAYTVRLPLVPFQGQTFTVKDFANTAATRNITIDGNGKNIDGSATFVINVNRSSITVCYEGTAWSII
jgi:hypothetical protein